MVELDIDDDWQIGRNLNPLKEPDACVREYHSEQTTQESEHQAFQQQLPKQPQTASTNREPDRDAIRTTPSAILRELSAMARPTIAARVREIETV